MDGLDSDLSMNRQQEKSTCNGVLGQSSCDLMSEESQTFLRFFWNQHLGNTTCADLRRDICYGIDDDSTEHCLRVLMPTENVKEGEHLVTSKDILILNAIPTNTNVWCSNNLQKLEVSDIKNFLHGYANKTNVFSPEEERNNENGETEKVCTPAYAAWAARMLLSVFPGRILWISYPMVNAPHLPLVNNMITKVNSITNYGINSVNHSRIQFVDLSSMLSDNMHLYKDMIHHHGDLSRMVIDSLFVKLDGMRENTA